MKTFGEIVGKFFKAIVSFIGMALKTLWIAACVLFLAMLAMFFLAVFFPEQVLGAIQIFKNLLKIP